MIEIKLKVPKDKGECQNSDCNDCDLNILTCGDCGEIWELGLNKMNNTESKEVNLKATDGSEIVPFPFVTTGPIRIDRMVQPFHLTFVPRLFRDGDMWCALYGENIMEGIVGFGRSPDKAIKRFDNAFYEDIVNNEIVEKPELSKKVNSRKVVLRENFC